jgi:hypothetical protein
VEDAGESVLLNVICDSVGHLAPLPCVTTTTSSVDASAPSPTDKHFCWPPRLPMRVAAAPIRRRAPPLVTSPLRRVPARSPCPRRLDLDGPWPRALGLGSQQRTPATHVHCGTTGRTLPALRSSKLGGDERGAVGFPRALAHDDHRGSSERGDTGVFGFVGAD